MVYQFDEKKARVILGNSNLLSCHVEITRSSWGSPAPGGVRRLLPDEVNSNDSDHKIPTSGGILAGKLGGWSDLLITVSSPRGKRWCASIRAANTAAALSRLTPGDEDGVV